MSFGKIHSGISTKADLVKSVWRDIETHLEMQKKKIYEEIRNYPSPIAACDQQFNYLLEQRTRISDDLERIRSAFHESLLDSDSIELIEKFIGSSSSIDEKASQKIRSFVEAGLMKLKTDTQFLRTDRENDS